MKIKILSRVFLAHTFCVGAIMPTAAAEMVNKTISNGMRIVAVEDHAAPAVFIRVLLPKGDNDDPPGLAGVAGMTAELVQKGAGSRDAGELAELVDGLGASIIGESGSEYTILGCNALKAHLDTAMEIVRDIVLHPRMDKREFSLIKDQVIANIKAQKSDPSYLAAVHLPPAVFGPDIPQGNVKTEKSVKSITLEDAQAFHAGSVQGAGAIAFCIGDIDAADVSARLEEMFQDIKQGAPPRLLTEIPKNKSPGKVVEVEKEDITQTTALIGKPAPGRLSPDYYSTLVANYVLGAGGFVSRLMAAVRGKEGKTYGIRSVIPSGATPDLFEIKFTTRNEELNATLQLTRTVLNEFIEKGPTEEETREAKEFYKGYFYLQTETPTQRARKMLAYLYYGLGLEELDRYPERIDAVTRNSAHQAARKYLTEDGLTTCLVGPKSVIQRPK